MRGKAGGPALSGDDVVRAARSWIGTPYHHQASTKGIGCDCLGLVRGVWCELYGSEAERPPAYARDWAEAGGRETMIEAAQRHLVAVGAATAGPGDVVLFRMRAGAPAKHAGIVTAPGRMIHAVEGRAVGEVALGTWWQRRMVAAFRYPGVD